MERGDGEMTNPTLERAARASFESHAWGDVGPDEKPHTWESLTEDWRDVYRKGARAVLMAVRDSDTSKQAMLIGDGNYAEYVNATFTAMIDAILAEGE